MSAGRAGCADRVGSHWIALRRKTGRKTRFWADQRRTPFQPCAWEQKTWALAPAVSERGIAH